MSEVRRITLSDHQVLMQTAFNQICDPVDWKRPINADVPWCLANVYGQAIEFMTATKPTYGAPRITANGEFVTLTAPGYDAGPAR